MSAPLRVFSDVQAAGLILPKKARYTVADCKAVIVDSLFRSGRTISRKEAAFIIRCSAAHHNTDYSRNAGRFGDVLPIS